MMTARSGWRACLAAGLAVGGSMALASGAGASPRGPGGMGSTTVVAQHLVPRYTVYSPGPAVPTQRTTSTTGLPTWSGSFTFSSTTYRYKMVGTNPATSSATTRVSTKLVPLVFKAGTSTFSSTGLETRFKESPLFESTKYASGTGEFESEAQRAEFWKFVKSTTSTYNVDISTPVVLSSKAYTVPSGDYELAVAPNGVKVLLVNLGWWQTQLKTLLGAEAFSASTLPLLLASNVFFYVNNNPSDCCVLGFHGAYGTGSAHTYAFSAWPSPGIFSGGVSDVTPMSHEVGEWMNDPYTSNVVPRWDQPDGATCFSDLLEVGDPIEALPKQTFAVTTVGGTYHPQDLAGISWFAHFSPSYEQNSKYSFEGYLTSPSTIC